MPEPLENNNVASNTIHRTRLERLSGWQLWLLLVTATINVGVLVAMIGLPLVLDSWNLRMALLILTSMNCIFVFAVHSTTTLSPTVKVVLSMGHVILCGVAAWNFHRVSNFVLNQTEASLYLVPVIQSLALTIGGFVFHFTRNDSKGIQFRFTVSDLMVLLFGSTILFPLILVILRSDLATFLLGLDFTHYLLAGKHALANCAIASLLASLAVWRSIDSRIWNVARLVLMWNLIVAIAMRFFSHADLFLDLVLVSTVWFLVCLVPLFAMPVAAQVRMSTRNDTVNVGA